MMELDERIGVEYDKAEALGGRCDIPRDTLLGWKNEAAQLKTELADYKKHFEPQMIQIRLHSDAVAHQEKAYRAERLDFDVRDCECGVPLPTYIYIQHTGITSTWEIAYICECGSYYSMSVDMTLYSQAGRLNMQWVWERRVDTIMEMEPSDDGELLEMED